MANVNDIPIKDLKDANGDLFYPITKTDAVFDDNGNSIETRLTLIITPEQWTQLQQIVS